MVNSCINHIDDTNEALNSVRNVAEINYQNIIQAMIKYTLCSVNQNIDQEA